MKIVYGNIYTWNSEEVENFEESVIYQSCWDYLDDNADFYKNEWGDLPLDWYETVFWKKID
jgi:hypothetical protein